MSGPRLQPRLQRLRAPAFLEVTRRAAALRAAGRPVLSLAFGEPGLAPPPAARASAMELIADDGVRYTAMDGTEALRAAVAERVGRRRGLAVSTDRVLVCVGATQALSSALRATVGPGDEVVVPAPYWPPYVDIVGLCDGVPVCPPGRAADGYKLTAAALRAAITPRTRWLLLNSPNNPSGAVYSRAELTRLAAVLRQAPHVGVISDEIYEDLVYAGHAPSLLELAPDLADRTLIVGGVSKTYGMTGYRVGWAVGPQRWIGAMTWVQALSTFTPPAVGQAAALAALGAPEAPLRAERQRLRRRRDRLVERLRAATELGLTPPDGAFYLLADVRPYLGRAGASGPTTDAELVLHLLDDVSVAAMPGAAFGLPGHVRLAFSGPDAAVDEAVDRIVGSLQRLAMPSSRSA